MGWLALCCAWRWKASAIPFDSPTERWRDCYPQPSGARQADRRLLFDQHIQECAAKESQAIFAKFTAIRLASSRVSSF
jgi:hypothetical protein